MLLQIHNPIVGLTIMSVAIEGAVLRLREKETSLPKGCVGRFRWYSVGDVERGERNISLINIWKLTDALGVHPVILFGYSERD